MFLNNFKKISLMVLLSVVGSRGLSLEAAERPVQRSLSEVGSGIVAMEAQEAIVNESEVVAQGSLDENMDNVFDAAAQARIEKDLNKMSTRCCMGISTAARWAAGLLLGSSVVLWGAQKITPMVSTVAAGSFLNRSAGYPLKMFGAAILCGVVSHLFDKRHLKAQIRACEIHEELKNNGLSLDQKRVAVAVIIDELFKRYQQLSAEPAEATDGEEKEELKLTVHACFLLRAQFN